MENALLTLIRIDGFLFLMIGIIVLITPSPQPGLTKKVNDEDLLPFSQTRRLLASMFLASALLLIVVGFTDLEFETLKKIGLARVVSFLLVIAINYNQYQSKRWKSAPLLVLMSVFGLMSVAYTYFMMG